MLGHGLRSPLASLSNCIERQSGAAQTPEARDRVLHMATRSIASMDEMITDLLEYTRTRLGRGGMQVPPRPGNLDVLCKEVVEEAAKRYGTSDPDYDPPGSVRSERIKLTDALTGAGTIDYLYDFGDSWEHRIKLEKVLPPTDMKLPLCVGGANAAPPDDCGGVPGHEEFEAMADPNHEEHANMKAWIGRDWDPAAFDLENVNSWLTCLEAHTVALKIRPRALVAAAREQVQGVTDRSIAE